MIATKESTVRDAVIVLLRNSRHGAIESVDLWDRVYSKQYHAATPGVTHKFIIGGYVLEYIKQDEFSDLIDVIGAAHEEATKLESASRLRGKLQVLALIVIFLALAYVTSQVFEDGSFILLGIIKGCLPWGICQ